MSDMFFKKSVVINNRVGGGNLSSDSSTVDRVVNTVNNIGNKLVSVLPSYVQEYVNPPKVNNNQFRGRSRPYFTWFGSDNTAIEDTKKDNAISSSSMEKHLGKEYFSGEAGKISTF